MQNKDFLGSAPLGKLLIKLALPAVVAQLINMLYNVVDRIYIGQMPGDGQLALTGLGVCMPIIIIVMAFAALISMGSAPRASISMGEGNFKQAEKILGNSFTLLIIISVIITAVLVLWNEQFLMAFGASENTISYAADYMNIYSMGTVFVLLTLGMNAFITAQGFAKTSMITVLIGAVLNIILDPIFIFTLDMGVRGAALATIISQGVSFVWVMMCLLGKKTTLKLRKKNMSINTRVMMPCLALGVSPFVMQASESILVICFNTSLLRYGGDVAVGAMTILTSVMQFAILPLQGLGQGAQPISGYCFGAKKMQRVRDTFKLLFKVCSTYSTLLWALIMIFPGVFARMFATDLEFIGFIEWALRIYAAMLLVMGPQVACQLTFISIGKAGASVLVAVMRKFILLIPLIFILPVFYESNMDKTMAVYLAEPVADTLAAVFTVVLFWNRFKKATPLDAQIA